MNHTTDHAGTNSNQAVLIRYHSRSKGTPMNRIGIDPYVHRSTTAVIIGGAHAYRPFDYALTSLCNPAIGEPTRDTYNTRVHRTPSPHSRKCSASQSSQSRSRAGNDQHETTRLEHAHFASESARQEAFSVIDEAAIELGAAKRDWGLCLCCLSLSLLSRWRKKCILSEP